MARVLIVDDSYDFAEFLRKATEEIGYEAKVLASNSYFERVLADWEPTILILDIVMPERDGLELLGTLAKQNFKGQIVLISGAENFCLSMSATSAKARGLHVAATLRKPCRKEELQQTLRNAAGAIWAPGSGH
jgi:DNA-binding response OmpR family regulator